MASISERTLYHAAQSSTSTGGERHGDDEDYYVERFYVKSSYFTQCICVDIGTEYVVRCTIKLLLIE